MTAISKFVQFNPDETGRQRLLGGPPETATMRSGLVILQPGMFVGEHSTGDREEVLVILEGEGSFLLEDSSAVPVNTGGILYCPPQTSHNVQNTGSGPLKYVYIVAKAR